MFYLYLTMSKVDLDLIAKVLFPEMLITLGILVTLMMSLFETTKKQVASVAAIFLALAALICLKQLYLPIEPELILFNSFTQDSLSLFFRFLIYTMSFFIVLGASDYMKVLESPAEYFSIMLCGTLGAGFLTGANDFLLLLVSLETLGLCAILLASYARQNRGSNEAGIKYLINSAVVTSVLLLGISLIYGLTGHTNFSEVSAKLFQLNVFSLISLPVVILISVCLVSALAFKFAAAPFHNWSPDVYQGAPTTTTLFLSVVSKLAAFGLAIRLFANVFNSDLVMLLFAIIAIASIIIGSYVGVVQILSRGSIKRLLAYSSIAQSGYLITALAVFQKTSISALVLYITVYAIMNTGAFLSAIYFERLTGSDKIYDFAGFINKRPAMVIAFSLFMINLAGLPFIPAGFIAKFFLFSAAFTAPFALAKVLAIVGLVGSLIGLFYYLYLLKILIVDPASTKVAQLEAKEAEPSCGLLFGTSALLVSLIGFGVFGMEVLNQVSTNAIAHMAG